MPTVNSSVLPPFICFHFELSVIWVVLFLQNIFHFGSSASKICFPSVWGPTVTVENIPQIREHKKGCSYCFFCPVHAGLPVHRVVTQLDFVGVDPVPTGMKTKTLICYHLVNLFLCFKHPFLYILGLKLFRFESWYYLTSRWSFGPAGWLQWTASGAARPPPATGVGPYNQHTRLRRTGRRPRCQTANTCYTDVSRSAAESINQKHAWLSLCLNRCIRFQFWPWLLNNCFQPAEHEEGGWHVESHCWLLTLLYSTRRLFTARPISGFHYSGNFKC